ncbi:ABC transporter ATP-binding protein [Devosia sp. Root685]|uniref:ATP-binding cassette domain-containing protein n=1 Tax=Devosia sp. Root685 TaxID=1736587 RepID=UPI0006FE5B50|nr:ABC transporter ATP-binding protein [Devosia sp. Root685]KRA97447.1 ABC transporter ATP-binding protein [Devosia sp. Root685]
MTAILTLENLSVSAGSKLLVSNLSLSLNRGERLGLIGESGSGKSLTSLAATGLLPAGLTASGSAILAGTQVIGAADRELNQLRGTAVAIVFQEPLTALDPLMRVGKQVAEPLARRAQRDGAPLSGPALDKAVLALLDEVALPDPQRIAKSYPHELSGGQRQRIAIAMALACKPDLLIADEPTTALDVTTQAEILNLLDRLVRDRNMALLFISHDLPVVANTVERVVVLRQGETVEAGNVAEVFRNPRHDYTKSLLTAARRLDHAMEGRA